MVFTRPGPRWRNCRCSSIIVPAGRPGWGFQAGGGSMACKRRPARRAPVRNAIRQHPSAAPCCGSGTVYVRFRAPVEKSGAGYRAFK